MHKFKSGQRLRVLEDKPCSADLCKGDVVIVIDAWEGRLSYKVERIGEDRGWYVKEFQLSPIHTMLENE